ncbi:hypothetical protein AB834_05435 [PVC group bacterium (ex Bugula neritina AB1)]|nr:hypothetical protein AB834_05435 [PVC group bacterium (ex Bugula neritina AB1)]
MKLNPFRKVHLFIIGGLIALSPLWMQRYFKKSLPIYGQISEFSQKNTQGEAFGSKNLLGKVWVANFIFTTCSGPCLKMSKNMASIHQSFKNLDDIRMVSFTVNPENDTPSVLKDYAEKYRADLQKWHFLTGPREEITKLLKEDFRVGHLEDIAFHSVYFVLVDDLGRIRGYYDGTNQDRIQQLVIDLSFQHKRSKKRQKKIKKSATSV